MSNNISIHGHTEMDSKMEDRRIDTSQYSQVPRRFEINREKIHFHSSIVGAMGLGQPAVLSKQTRLLTKDYTSMKWGSALDKERKEEKDRLSFKDYMVNNMKYLYEEKRKGCERRSESVRGCTS